MTRPVANAQARIGADLPAVACTPSLATLINAKIRFFTPMIIIYMVGYIGLTALAGFAKGFMALKVIGTLNVGFFLIACTYVLSLVIALAYVRIANATLDPMVQRVVSALRARGALR
jgi:uncharacterized membrane protein (DUF485 family)